jgi:hypothetical protein
MNVKVLALTSVALAAGQLAAQQQQPALYQTAACVKVQPGKWSEFREFSSTATRKLMEQSVADGRRVSWSLLRAVMPAGDEARCDYLSISVYENAPPEPSTSSDRLEASLKKAGVGMTAADYLAKRESVSRLVAMEMWRPRVRVGSWSQGHYLFINHMKVHNMSDYAKFEMEIWKPIAENWIKDGAQSGWVFATAALPGGSDVKYAALSADIYPTWEAVFKNRSLKDAFQKAHPGKDYEQTVSPMGKLRDLAVRELWRIEERVAKQ